MNITEIKKKKELIKENRSSILGLTAFFAALFFLIWIGSLGFYW
ncbi:MAG TPA: hypothetical protein VMV43_01620 [Candidatus Nanopelagicaceae bacterium]|nr:hypothetical protein [Candidatus Nanopelagicaceae bacterium]